jgi:hypothetical protein
MELDLQVLTAATMKTTIFGDVTLLNLVKEEFFLLGYIAVSSGRSQQTIRRSILPPSSG